MKIQQIDRIWVKIQKGDEPYPRTTIKEYQSPDLHAQTEENSTNSQSVKIKAQ